MQRGNTMEGLMTMKRETKEFRRFKRAYEKLSIDQKRVVYASIIALEHQDWTMDQLEAKLEAQFGPRWRSETH
jgi:hypothetical protein